MNSREAMVAFEAASGLAPGEPNHKELRKALRASAAKPIVSYSITAEDASGPFIQTIPGDMTETSKLPGLYYTSVLEKLGEKFHSAPALLSRLNPRARFAAGEHIRVPNVLGAPQESPTATHAAGFDRKREPSRNWDRQGGCFEEDIDPYSV